MASTPAQITSFIGGRHVPSLTTYDNIDPATNQTIGQIARGGFDEVDQAVIAARSGRHRRRQSPAVLAPHRPTGTFPPARGSSRTHPRRP